MQQVNRPVLVIAVIAVGIAGLVAFSADWKFWQRYMTQPKTAEGLSVSWFQPQETVAGAYRPLETVADGPGQYALDDALEIAEEYDSDALLVALDGKIIAESYWNGATSETKLLTFSFHKTISALLVGLAIEDGYIAGADVPLGDLIPEWEGDPRGQVKLRDAMRMSGGFSHPDNARGPFSSAARFKFSSDIEKRTLEATLSAQPQPAFDYGERPAQIVGMALQNALPVPYGQYLSNRLWAPIGASEAAITFSRKGGQAITYCCLMANARDWLRIGLLLEGKGTIDGRRVISQNWLEQMTESSPTNPNFGLFIWRGDPHSAARSYTPAVPAVVRSAAPFAVDDVIFLDGAGGQRIYVSPSLNLVIVRIGAYRPDWDDTKLFNSIAGAISRPIGSAPGGTVRRINPAKELTQ